MFKMLFAAVLGSLLLTGCLAARTDYRAVPVLRTTTTLPPRAPMTSMAPLSPVPLTIIQEPATPPSPAVCTDAIDVNNPLGRLRIAMKTPAYTQMNSPFDAFVIFYTDEHLSEEPLDSERRLQYISGWEGAGTGAVLADGGAAIWVPSGAVQRARATLSCAWFVLDADDPGQQTVAEWISERLARSGKVGADARLTSVGEWQILTTTLLQEGLTLIHMPSLLDQVWNEEPNPMMRRPDFPKTVATNYQMEYAGQTWREKVFLLRRALRESGVDSMVVTALDEVAWLLNVRGRDLPYAPLLKAFVIVSMKDVRIYVPPGKLSVHVGDVLAVYNCYSNNCTRVNDYTNIYNDLRARTDPKMLIPAPGTFQRGASAAIAQAVPAAKRVYLLSPIIYLKAQKNKAEINGMKKAHLRDAVTMCTLLSYLEGKSGLSELSVAITVDRTRDTEAGYIGPSMKTRVAYGIHTADPDYRATNVTSTRIFKNSTLVIQSGGQYDEGTTVVTRTVHYGAPSGEQKRAYTTVLRAHAALAGLRAPSTLPAPHVDPVLRTPLWASNQDYLYPTGYSVGAALTRKEDPVVMDYRQDRNLHTFKDGYFINVEPGWYEEKKFGIYLGNIYEVLSKNNSYIEFYETTLVPFEPKLIDKSLLTEYEIIWLNRYNERIRKEIGPELKARGLPDVFFWMMNKTQPFELPSKLKRSTSKAVNPHSVSVTLLAFITVHIFL